MSWPELLAVLVEAVGPAEAERVASVIRAKLGGCRLTVPTRRHVTPPGGRAGGTRQAAGGRAAPGRAPEHRVPPAAAPAAAVAALPLVGGAVADDRDGLIPLKHAQQGSGCYAAPSGRLHIAAGVVCRGAEGVVLGVDSENLPASHCPA